MNILTQLKRPFGRIHWRVGARTKDQSKGQVLAYIDARDVMKRLDDVCGTNWQCSYLPVHTGVVICQIGLLLDGDWLWRANGAGETDIEGEKGAASDAFKRAAVMWGIGRYLYQLTSPWVDLQNGRLPRDFTPPKLPAWATPEGFDELMRGKADE